MPTTGPRYTMDEFEQRGDAIYEADVLPHLKPEDQGKAVAIDIETGAYEIDADEIAAVDRLYARLPDAQPWMRRVGSSSFRHFGAREWRGLV